MKALTAEDANYSFGRLTDRVHAKPVAVAKHGRPIVVVMAVKDFGWLAPVREAERIIGRPA